MLLKLDKKTSKCQSFILTIEVVFKSNEAIQPRSIQSALPSLALKWWSCGGQEGQEINSLIFKPRLSWSSSRCVLSRCNPKSIYCSKNLF